MVLGQSNVYSTFCGDGGNGIDRRDGESSGETGKELDVHVDCTQKHAGSLLRPEGEIQPSRQDKATLRSNSKIKKPQSQQLRSKTRARKKNCH